MRKTPQEIAKGWAGWSKLIEQLFTDIYEIYPEFQYVQLKEKFGGLRLYAKWCPPEHDRQINALILDAQRRSYKTCEICGSRRGAPREGSWIKTLCKKHAEGRKILKW